MSTAQFVRRAWLQVCGMLKNIGVLWRGFDTCEEYGQIQPTRTHTHTKEEISILHHEHVDRALAFGIVYNTNTIYLVSWH